MGVGGFGLTYFRMKAIDVLYPHWIDFITFAIIAPTKYHQHDFGITILLKPFFSQVWYSLLGAFILFFILNQIKTLLMETSNRNERENLIWINLSYLFVQPIKHFRSINSALKFSICTWLFSVIFLRNLYSGFLFATNIRPLWEKMNTIEKFVAACESRRIIPIVRLESLFQKSLIVS